MEAVIVGRSPDRLAPHFYWNGTITQFPVQEWGASHGEIVRKGRTNMVQCTIFSLLTSGSEPPAVEGVFRPSLTSIYGGLLYRLHLKINKLFERKKTAFRARLSPAENRSREMVPCTMLFGVIRT